MSPARANEIKPFPSTHWSMVVRAGHGGEEQQREALESLLLRYLPALRAHLLLRKRVAADRAEDLLQGFVTDKVVEQNLVAAARRERGKFRSFILVALNRYMIDQARRENSQARSPAEGKWVDIQHAGDLASDSAEPADQFNLAWAREVIAEAARRMQADCEMSGRMDLWQLFCRRVLKPYAAGSGAASNGPSSCDMQPLSPAKESNLLITARRSFARALRAVVGEYAEDEQAIDEEIRDLKRALSHGA